MKEERKQKVLHYLKYSKDTNFMLKALDACFDGLARESWTLGGVDEGLKARVREEIENSASMFEPDEG
jgi:hypothetical protein